MRQRLKPIVRELPPGIDVLALENQLRRLYEEIAEFLDTDNVEQFPS